MVLLHIFLNIIVFIGTLGMLILVHEYGHFLVARFFKVKVERFSVGFGPILWSRIDSYGTEYIISAILLGGYVKLADFSMTEIDRGYSFSSLLCYYKYFWKRVLIIIAGPVFNFIFAVLLYIIAFMIGLSSYKPIVNYILKNSLVEQSGMSIGSEIKLINGIPVNDWESICIQILNSFNKEKIAILTEKVDTIGLVSSMNIIFLPVNGLNKVDFSIINNPIATLGMFPNVARIVSTVSNKELYFLNQQDNLQIDDKILLINGQFIYNWESFVKIIKNNFNKKLNIIIERNNHIFNLDCKFIENDVSSSEKVQKNIDLFLDTVVVDAILHAETHRYGFCAAIFKSINKVWNCIYYIIYTLSQLVCGDVKINSLHGPIEIAKIASQTIRYGIVSYVVFLALISINLGVINLLPFPVLDGGRLLFLLIENILHRPISLKMQNIIYIISFVILIIIFCITLYNDIIE